MLKLYLLAVLVATTSSLTSALPLIQNLAEVSQRGDFREDRRLVAECFFGRRGRELLQTSEDESMEHLTLTDESSGEEIVV